MYFDYSFTRNPVLEEPLNFGMIGVDARNHVLESKMYHRQLAKQKAVWRKEVAIRYCCMLHSCKEK